MMESRTDFKAGIDIGGTFTDGYFMLGDREARAKVLTTYHDLSEGLLSCITRGVEQLGVDLSHCLARSDAIRLSTTLGTNTLVKRDGPSIGLIVTRGFEQDLYHGCTDAVPPLLRDIARPELVSGIRESMSTTGVSEDPPNVADVLECVRVLISRGARRIGVCLRNGGRNPSHELAVRSLLRDVYPEYYLRSVPIQLSYALTDAIDDGVRVATAAVNAYLHGALAAGLYRSEDLIRTRGLSRPLLIGHADGSCARVAKTNAVQTLSGGPAAGLQGAAAIAGSLGIERVLTMDIGGTSMDFSVIETERLVPTNAPTVMGVRLGVRMLETTSIGVAGGSIAWLRQDQVMVGPVSAGSTPGPACYGRGGKQPTVTDANLVLGLIDPAQPLGGRIRVLHSLADDVLDRAIGAPLGVSSIDAAHAIRNVVNSNIASTITEHLREHQIDTTDLALFAFGGGGPLHACAVAELLDVSFVLGADCGSVFCAYASCTLDECQELHESISGATAKPLEAAIQETCRRLWQQAQMLFEGASRPDVDVRYKWNVELAGIDVGSRIEFDEQGGGIRPLDLANWLAGESAQGQQVVGVVLRVTIPASARTDPGDPSTVDCLTGFGDPVKREGVVPHRRIHWDEGSEAVNTPVYDFSQLSEIEPVAGPAIFEGVDTCWVVPQGWVARAGLRRTILLRRP